MGSEKRIINRGGRRTQQYQSVSWEGYEKRVIVSDKIKIAGNITIFYELLLEKDTRTCLWNYVI